MTVSRFSKDYWNLGEKHTFFTDCINVTNLVNVNQHSNKPLSSSFFHRAILNPVNWYFPILVYFSFQILFLTFLLMAGTDLEGRNMPVGKERHGNQNGGRQRRIQNPVKHLRGRVLWKKVNGLNHKKTLKKKNFMAPFFYG